MTAKHPEYFAFYPLDFAGDGKVEAMSTIGVGAYILLLCKAWHERPPGSLPDDDALLAKWARMDAATWVQVKSEVVAAFRFTHGRWVQKRLTSEYRRTSTLLRKKSTGGKEGAKRRWDKPDEPLGVPTNPDGSPNGSASGTPAIRASNLLSSSLSDPGPLVFPGGSGGAERGPKLSDELAGPEFAAAWAGWVEHRRQLRLAELTPQAVQAQWLTFTRWKLPRSLVALRFTVEKNSRNIIEPDPERTSDNGHPGGAGKAGGGASGMARHIAAQAERDARMCGPKPKFPGE